MLGGMDNWSRILVLLSVPLFAISCERWSWPAYEKSARVLFEENEYVFGMVRQNMEIDNLAFMSDAYARGRNRIRAGLVPPTLSADLQKKYSALIDEGSAFQYQLAENVFIVDVSTPSIRDFYLNFSFVQGELSRSIPHCTDSGPKQAMCGNCYVPVKDDWTMFWSWSPKDTGKEDESCEVLGDAA